MEWDIKLPKAYGAMSRDDRKGRNPFEGTLRGYGLERGNVAELCRADPLFNEAIRLARTRTFLHWPHIMNLYMLTRFFVPRLAAGSIVEFGSRMGGSAIFMARVAQESVPNARVYGFDTFAGMPETDSTVDAHVTGDLKEGVDIGVLRRYVAECGLDNLAFIQGLFEDTAASALAEIGPVALVHIDCDIYSAVAYAYDVVKPHLVDEAYIVFDDPLYGHCLGAFEAVEERLIRRDGLHAEQTYPHLVFRHRKA